MILPALIDAIEDGSPLGVVFLWLLSVTALIGAGSIVWSALT